MLGKWLRRRKAALPTIIDPWLHAEGTYVGGFRKQLSEIAEELSKTSWRRVKVCFNPDFGCAELYDVDKGVIARIKVHGSECSPYEAIIRTDFPLSAKVQVLFSRVLPVRVEFQTVNTW